MKWHNRHEYMQKTGKRISRGAWERLNRAYDVHHVATRRYFQGHDVDGNEKWLTKKCYTYVLTPETTKANRKVSLRDRFNKLSKRSRYNNSTPVWQVR